MATVIAPPTLPTVRPRRRNIWRSLPPKAKVGAVILLVFIVVAIIGPWIAPYAPDAQSTLPSQILAAPSSEHLLGTTATGEDVMSQLLAGTRSTVVIGLLTGLIVTTLAVIVGTAAGFLGGLWDEALSFVSNIFMILPALPLMVVLLAYQSARSDLATILVLSALGWPLGARIIRSQTLSLRGRDFIAAARETGERTWRLILCEVTPNQLSLIAASFVGAVLYAVGTSVALAFLGLANTSEASLGTILYWAQSENALPQGAWWWFIPPGVLVAVLGAGLVLLNFGIDEFGSPRLRDATRHRRAGGRPWRPADPTPVERAGDPLRRGRFGRAGMRLRDTVTSRADAPGASTRMEA